MGTEYPSVGDVETILTTLSVPVDSEKIGLDIQEIEGREYNITIGHLVTTTESTNGGNEEEAAPLDLGDMFDF